MSILGIALPILGVGGIGAAIAFIPGVAAIAGRAAAGALAFLSKLPWYAFVIAALAGFAFLEWHGRISDDASSQKKIAGLGATIAADVKAMKTMTTSLHGALGAIDERNKELDAQANELAAMKQQDAASVARSNARYGPTGAAVVRLNTSASDKGLAPCRVSDEALRALGGL